jgi:prolyl-tRNA synthetase
MYTFDRDEVSAEKTFHAVTAAYRRLFQRLKLPCDQVDADTGSIGGSSSQEFQVPSAIGDDEIVTCEACGKVANRELWERVKEGCDVSGCDTAETSTSMGLEVGHAFLLGRKYSKTFDVTFLDEHEVGTLPPCACPLTGRWRLFASL